MADKKIDDKGSMPHTSQSNSNQSAAPKGDNALEIEVKTALTKIDDIKFSDLNVSCHNGVIELGGSASTQKGIQKAISVAENIKGVKSVTTKLKVQEGRETNQFSNASKQNQYGANLQKDNQAHAK